MDEGWDGGEYYSTTERERAKAVAATVSCGIEQNTRRKRDREEKGEVERGEERRGKGMKSVAMREGTK